MTNVKICGIRNTKAALAAAEAGADLLGLVFEPGSRRCVPVEEARQIVEKFHGLWPHEKPRWVGVFVNQTLEEVNHILDYCGLDLAQLSGAESLEYCHQVSRPIIKVFHVKDDLPLEQVLEAVEQPLSTYRQAGHLCLLDTFKQGLHGGTGQAFDWQVARELARSYSFLLAGGLNPENVSEAIGQVGPWGVDVSSGVETNGKKSAAKVAEFIAQVRRTDQVLQEAKP